MARKTLPADAALTISRVLWHSRSSIPRDIKGWAGEGRIGARPPLASTRAVVLIGVLLLCGCAKVKVTPLGSTREGRPQFEITCNKLASDSGSCHEKALAACKGDYETLDIETGGLSSVTNDGELFTSPSHRALLIACNRQQR